MSTTLKSCSVCARDFLVKFRFQLEHRQSGGVVYYCSQTCRDEATSGRGEVACDACGKSFALKYAYQQAHHQGREVMFCSMDCRNSVLTDYRKRVVDQEHGPMRIAVLNQKGGTGKTTTTVSVGAGLAEAGHRVLIVDVDAQGHVGISLGVDGDNTMYHLMVEKKPLEQCVVQARPNLDIVVGDETLAQAEIVLARMNEGHHTALREQLIDERGYDFILLDCGPSLSLLNMNALTFADHLIIPVSCDYLSLIGVKQVMKTLKNVNQVLMHRISILGILPTFYDMRNNISDEAVRTLKGYFRDQVLPPIRVNTRLKEAPGHQQTIFEYAPDCRGAKDYRKLVRWLVEQQESRYRAA